MIKGVVQPPGQPLMLILGLSGENVARLAGGEPIAIRAADLGLPEMTIVIMYGTTEDDILKELETSGLTSPAATVVDRREPSP